jgi:hypothetical protein
VELNGDANMDLMTVNRFGCSTLLGNGDGTFQPPLAVGLPAQVPPNTDLAPVAQSAGSMAVGDVNADGKPDLVASGSIQYQILLDYIDGEPYYEHVIAGYFNVLLGMGDGTFGAGNAEPLGAYRGIGRLGLWDFNGDGRLDVLTDYDRVRLGNGDGTFQNAQPHSLGNLSSNPIQEQDFDGDGKLDMLVWGDHALIAMLANGDGSFARARPRSQQQLHDLRPHHRG